jgi:hypothetical protein
MQSDISLLSLRHVQAVEKDPATSCARLLPLPVISSRPALVGLSRASHLGSFEEPIGELIST